MPHVFVSYVREDATVVDYVVAVLRANGLEVWLDRDNIRPGLRWRDAIQAGVRQGDFFLAFFSAAWAARERTVANEELIFAIEELRQRPRDRAWFIPLRINDCAIPEHPIGAGETLGDIQFIDFPALGWEDALRRLLAALGVPAPILLAGEPLGNDLPAAAKLTGGELTYLEVAPPVPGLQGAVMAISGGWCSRVNGDVVAYIETRAPQRDWQLINEQLGLNSFYAICLDHSISTDPAAPCRFHFRHEFMLPPGSEALHPATGERMTMPIEIPVATEFLALAYAQQDRLLGTFDAILIYSVPGFGDLRFDMKGDFDISFQADYAPRI